jgi:hypothetical protein
MKTIDRVLKLLNEEPRFRDDDELLIATIWWQECDKEMTAFGFLMNYSKGMYTSAESIRRCRQKLQQEFPGLRGKTWMERHKVDYKEIFTN